LSTPGADTLTSQPEHKSVSRKFSLEGSSGGCYLILKLKPAVSSKPYYKGVGRERMKLLIGGLFLYNPKNNT
jgi:hypothetical protein